MAVEHLTIVTCYRCKTQKSYARYEHRDWYSNYAIAVARRGHAV